MKKPLKDVEVALQFLQEVIRTDKYEVLIGSASAVFDAVLALVETLKCRAPHVQVSIVDLFIWSVLTDKLRDLFLQFADSC